MIQILQKMWPIMSLQNQPESNSEEFGFELMLTLVQCADQGKLHLTQIWRLFPILFDKRFGIDIFHCRYGPNYLKHVQSFRAYGSNGDFEKDGFSWSEKAKNGWLKCKESNVEGGNKVHHSCLERLDSDGNIDLIPPMYPASRARNQEYWGQKN